MGWIVDACALSVELCVHSQCAVYVGPAYAISKVLLENNLTVDDIDVWEIHEAFAGQVLANLKVQCQHCGSLTYA